MSTILVAKRYRKFYPELPASPALEPAFSICPLIASTSLCSASRSASMSLPAPVATASSATVSTSGSSATAPPRARALSPLAVLRGPPSAAPLLPPLDLLGRGGGGGGGACPDEPLPSFSRLARLGVAASRLETLAGRPPGERTEVFLAGGGAGGDNLTGGT